MLCILSNRVRRILKQFALSKSLVALDFDGTLAPIVPRHPRAALRPSTRKLLRQLASLYPCVVISGRARKDVGPRLRGIGLRDIVGNHGIEPWNALPRLAKTVRRWLPLLRDKLQNFPGVLIEDKRFSLAIHYRNEPQKRKVRATIAAAARTLGSVRMIAGKQVVNLLPAGTPNKGIALQQALRKMRCTKAIYVGDDDTDEDVFALPLGGRLLAISVGLNRNSLARYYIPRQRDIDRLLRKLIELRTAGKYPRV